MMEKEIATIVDFVTGEEVPDVGAEANRQAVERILVKEKGFDKADIEVDAAIEIAIAGVPYRSQVDLVVSVDGNRVMAVKCAAGSLGSREREILAAARLLDRHQLRRAAVSDGKNAVVLETVTGKKVGEGLAALPSKEEARHLLQSTPARALAPERCEREKLIFRSYDSMNVNVRRNL